MVIFLLATEGNKKVNSLILSLFYTDSYSHLQCITLLYLEALEQCYVDQGLANHSNWTQIQRMKNLDPACGGREVEDRELVTLREKVNKPQKFNLEGPWFCIPKLPATVLAPFALC